MKHIIESIIPGFNDRQIPIMMGILNVTSDSFSDGNQYIERDTAIEHALAMIREGADIIDIGGESSRPGSLPVTEELELSRICPVIEGIRQHSQIPISLDTTKASVAEAGIRLGVRIINDISALRFDPEMQKVLLKYPETAVVLMHMQGTPEQMQVNPHYEDVLHDIMEFFTERIQYCVSNGIGLHRIIIDPGIGFGKRLGDNLKILRNIAALKKFGVPVLLGASRKNFINMLDPSEVHERLGGTLAVTAQAFMEQVEILRIHDIQPNKQFLLVLNAIHRS